MKNASFKNGVPDVRLKKNPSQCTHTNRIIAPLFSGAISSSNLRRKL
jgi:hypothetical protein